jgi:hypothetical protein
MAAKSPPNLEPTKVCHDNKSLAKQQKISPPIVAKKIPPVIEEPKVCYGNKRLTKQRKRSPPNRVVKKGPQSVAFKSVANAKLLVSVANARVLMPATNAKLLEQERLSMSNDVHTLGMGDGIDKAIHSYPMPSRPIQSDPVTRHKLLVASGTNGCPAANANCQVSITGCQLEQKTKVEQVEPKLPKELRTVIGKKVEGNQKKPPASKDGKEPSIVQRDKIEVPTEDSTEVYIHGYPVPATEFTNVYTTQKERNVLEVSRNRSRHI